ncbi:catalase family peroxidase [Methylobacterium sp. ID0610]|uniref:catalase family peroxidase n=1 Tax=Methylobacterium carpenticola TaxID=3344827 RepID=UPI003686BC7A
MRESLTSSLRANIGSCAVIGAVVTALAGAFAATAGWLSPGRLTPTKIVDALAPAGGPALGHRRNHAKGICFTGVFESNGRGAAYSRATVFAPGAFAALGRFNLGTADPNAPDATVRVRGLGLQITAADGAVWRSAMIDPPFFPVSTPQAFYDLLLASRSKDPEAMKAFAAAHPEFKTFGAWAASAPWTASYAEERYNGLNAFLFVDASGAERPVRWSFVPQAPVVPISSQDLAKLGPDHLEREIAERVARAPQRWTAQVTLAEPGDATADPSQAWPATRTTVEIGTLVVQAIEAEADGPCREINFDPTVLPDGIRVSDDPFPAARSAAYARSYDLRTAEAKHYPARAASKGE